MYRSIDSNEYPSPSMRSRDPSIIFDELIPDDALLTVHSGPLLLWPGVWVSRPSSTWPRAAQLFFTSGRTTLQVVPLSLTAFQVVHPAYPALSPPHLHLDTMTVMTPTMILLPLLRSQHPLLLSLSCHPTLPPILPTLISSALFPFLILPLSAILPVFLPLSLLFACPAAPAVSARRVDLSSGAYTDSSQFVF